MSRLMSVAETTEQVRARRKTVTRRLGWLFLKPGDTLSLVDRNPRTGKPWNRIAEVEVVSVTRQPLWMLKRHDVRREGFPGWSDEQFIAFYCLSFGVTRTTTVTRIEWRYIEDEP